MKLDLQDLNWAIQRLPLNLKVIMKDPDWKGNIFVGGGFIRSIVAKERINDIDLFVRSYTEAEMLAYELCSNKEEIIKTDNAFTVKGKIAIQIIHRWLFNKPEDVINSFDFTICCAVIYFDGEKYDSFCDDRFYTDLASKRLVYRCPVRNEDAGGSMLRVLKYYQKGYCIPVNSLGNVIARLVKSMEYLKNSALSEEDLGKEITSLLREVDPEVDPLHLSHLPSSDIKQ